MQTNIMTIHCDDGTTEIRWGRAERDDDLRGYILIHPDGTATFPHGDGFVIFLAGEDTRVVEGEDNYPGVEPGENVLWHSKSMRES